MWFTPVTMKKGRPGVVLHALVAPARRGQAAEIVFAGTSTFGLRVTPVRRLLLDERREKVEVAGLTVRVRLGFLGGELVTAAPEYEDCRAVATRTGPPAARRLPRGGGGREGARRLRLSALAAAVLPANTRFFGRRAKFAQV